ncbi:MAG: hypothetical protein KJO50_06570 [Bacteroidia bacterium]|nr:hypothetical protein [Bacteroidia bacterium]
MFFLTISFTHSSCQVNKVVQVENEFETTADYLITGDFKILDTDKLGNIYLVDNDNEIRQYDKNLSLLFRYSLNSLGDIHHIDVSNPHKILVYYPDFQNVLFLDNTLSEQKTLNLNVLGYWNTTGMALSRENNIWTYNTIDNNLIKINDQGKKLLSSNELFFEDPLELESIKIYEQEGRLYLYDNSVIHVFGNFGEYITRHLISNQDCQFTKEGIYYLSNHSIKYRSFSIQFDQADILIYAAENVRDFHVTNRVVYILDKHGLFSTPKF